MPHRPRSRPHLPAAAIVAAAVLLGACKDARLPGVYRIDVQQGNVITQEQLAALERGMEKRKVRFILGTPLVADAFNPGRWDYYYSFEHGNGERVQRVVSVYFEDERLVRVGGDVRAATGPIVAETRKDELVTVPEGYRDDGILAALTPNLFSRREKFTPPTPDTPAAGDGSDGAASADAPPAIEVTAEDARYLRELLDGFGAPPETPTAEAQAPAKSQAQAPAQEEEGLFSRWARQLGIGDDEPPAAGSGAAGQPPPAE